MKIKGRKVGRGKILALLLVAVLVVQIASSLFSFGSDAGSEGNPNNVNQEPGVSEIKPDEDITDSAVDEKPNSAKSGNETAPKSTEPNPSRVDIQSDEIGVMSDNDPVVTPETWGEFKTAISGATVNRTINVDKLVGTPGDANLGTISQDNDILITANASGSELTAPANTILLNINNTGSGQITIKDLKLSAPTGAVKAISGKWVVEDVQITSLSGGKTALDFSGGAADVTINKSTLQNLGGTALKGSTNKLTIKKSTFDTISQRAVILSANSNVDITQTYFNKCKDGFGSVVLIGEGTHNVTLNMTNCTVENSTGSGGNSGYYGGVVSAHKGTGHKITIEKSSFINNSAARYGAAIGLTQFAGKLTINDSYFEGNAATDTASYSRMGDGGAVGIFNNMTAYSATFEMNGCTFDGNTAVDDAGALFLEGTNANPIKGTVKNTTFVNNIGSNSLLEGDSGGAVQISNGANVTFDSNTFYKNEKGRSRSGGAIGFHSDGAAQIPTISLINNLFIDNKGSGKYQNVSMPSGSNFVNQGGNIGLDNNSNLPVGLTTKSIFGTDTPIKENGYSVGSDKYEASLFHLIIAPPANPTETEGIYAAGAGTSGGITTDVRGHERKSTPDAGAVEIGWIRFDANGGDWKDLTGGYDGKSYFPKADGGNGYIKVTTPKGSIKALGDTDLSNGAMTLNGWNTSANGSGTTRNIGEEVEEKGQTLYALWKSKSIEKRNLTFTAIDTNKVYNGDEQTVETDVKIEGDLFADHKYVKSTATAKGYDVDTYKLTFGGIKIEDKSNNPIILSDYYNVTYVPGKFKITQKDITIKPVDATKEYDGTELKASDIEVVSGLVGNDKLNKDNVVYTGSQTNVGTSSSTVSGAQITHDTRGNVTKNYKINYAPGELTVTGNAKELTLTAKNNEVTYDAKPHGITNIEILPSDATITFSTSEAGIYTAIMPVYTEVGNYDIWVKASKEGYKDATTKATLKINKRPVTLKPVDASKIYDDKKLVASKVMIKSESLADGQSLNIADAVFTGSQTNVGKSNSSVSDVKIAKSNGFATSNYRISYDIGTLTVKANAITIKPVDVTKQYDGTALKVSDVKVSKGSLLSGHTLSIKNAKFSGSQISVGSSKSNVSGVEIKGAKKGNYDISYTSGILTVTAAHSVIPVEPDPPAPAPVASANPVLPSPSTAYPSSPSGSIGSTDTTTEVSSLSDTVPVDNGGSVAGVSHTPETLAESNVSTIDVGDNEVPLYGTESYSTWALINLILTIAGTTLIIFIGIKIVLRKRQEGDLQYNEYTDIYTEEPRQTKFMWVIISVLLAIAQIIFFFFTEDMTAEMVLFDKLTIVNAILFALEVIGIAFIFRKKEEVNPDDMGTI